MKIKIKGKTHLICNKKEIALILATIDYIHTAIELNTVTTDELYRLPKSYTEDNSLLIDKLLDIGVTLEKLLNTMEGK